MFKVGDKVKVVRSFENEYPEIGWDSDMLRWVGKEVIVEDVGYSNRKSTPMSYFAGYWWPNAVLEAVEDEATRLEAEAIIRDAMRYRSLIHQASAGEIDYVVARRNWSKTGHDQWEMLNLDCDGNGKEQIDALIDAQIEKQR